MFSGIYNFWNSSASPINLDNNTEVLILVLNTPFTYLQRNYIRETFGQRIKKSGNLKHTYKLLFLFGLKEDYQESFDEIFNESDKYNDLIIPKIEDNYNTVSLKMLSSFYWISQINQNSKLKWIIKIDDDVLLNIEKLDTYVNTIIQNELTDSIYCRVYYGIKPMRQGKW